MKRGRGCSGWAMRRGARAALLGAALAAGLSAARVLAEVLEGCLEVPADAGLEALLRAGRAAASEGRSGEGAACFLRAERSARGRAAALAEVGVALAGAGGRGAQRVCGAARAALGAGSTAAAVEPDVLLCEGLALLGPTAPAGAEAPPDSARGVALLRQAAELRPGDPRLGHYLGEALFQSVQFSARAGDHAAALVAADGALDRAPGRPAAWAAKVLKARGVAQRHLGLPREAAASFERALQAAPGDPELRANLGLLLGQLGDAAGAVAHLRATTREATGFFEAPLHLAGELQGQFRHGEALEALERALALESPRAWAQKLQLQRELCLWNDLAAVEARVAGDARRQLEGGTSASSAPLRTSLTPFDVLLTRTVPPELARSVAERYHAAALVAVAAEVADRPDGGGGGGAAPPSPPPLTAAGCASATSAATSGSPRWAASSPGSPASTAGAAASRPGCWRSGAGTGLSPGARSKRARATFSTSPVSPTPRLHSASAPRGSVCWWT